MSNIFSNEFVADEKNLRFLQETMWGPSRSIVNSMNQRIYIFEDSIGV
jgi:hypothetical protein